MISVWFSIVPDMIDPNCSMFENEFPPPPLQLPRASCTARKKPRLLALVPVPMHLPSNWLLDPTPLARAITARRQTFTVWALFSLSCFFHSIHSASDFESSNSSVLTTSPRVICSRTSSRVSLYSLVHQP